jgi:hypothetical protein
MKAVTTASRLPLQWQGVPLACYGIPNIDNSVPVSLALLALQPQEKCARLITEMNSGEYAGRGRRCALLPFGALVYGGPE